MGNKYRTGMVLVMLLISTALLIWTPDKASGDTAAEDEEGWLPIWDHSVAFEGQSGKATDGLDIGEVYPDIPGMETVFTSRDSWVYLSYMGEGAWKNEKLWSAPGQQLTPAIGDLRSDIPGAEILVVGLSSGSETVDPGVGTATVLRLSGSQWVAETIYTFPSLIHGCAIGDVDPTIPGNEAVLTTFAKNGTGITVLAWYDQTAKVWKNSTMFSESGNVRKAVIADVLPERPGLEVLTVTNKGNCTLAYGNHTNWTASNIYDGDSLARVCVGNLDPDENLEVYLGTGTNKVIGLKRSGSTWTPQTLFTDTDQNRGVWVGDVDPSIPGPELYSFSYSRRLVQITGTFSTGWKTKDIFLDTARSHDIRIGDVRASTPGPEIMLVGYSNNVTVISPRSSGTPSLPTVSGKTAETIDSGAMKAIDLVVSANGPLTVTSSTSSKGITMSQLPATLQYYGKVRITIQANPSNVDSTARIDVKVMAEGVWTWHNITISIKADTLPPTVSKVMNATGAVLQPNATIAAEEVLNFVFSEPVTRASFDAATVEKKLKVVWGGKERDAVFLLSADGRTISIDLNGLAPIGTVTVTMDGLKDDAGNNIQARTLSFKVAADEDDPPVDDLVLTIVIGIIILIVIIVLFILIYGGSKKKDDAQGDEEMNEEETDGSDDDGTDEGSNESEDKEE